MIAWKDDYMWKRDSARKRRKQIIKIIVIAVSLAAVLYLFVAASMEAFASKKHIEKEYVRIEVIAQEITEEPVKIQKWNEEECYVLAKMAMAEAEGESIEGKAMVIKVVLNRVNTKEFPDSIEKVVFQHSEKKDVYQFSSVRPGGRWWRVEPDEECYKALELIEEGWDESDGALYFEAEANGEDTWHSRNLEYIKTVGNHKFYK